MQIERPNKSYLSLYEAGIQVESFTTGDLPCQRGGNSSETRWLDGWRGDGEEYKTFCLPSAFLTSHFSLFGKFKDPQICSYISTISSECGQKYCREPRNPLEWNTSISAYPVQYLAFICAVFSIPLHNLCHTTTNHESDSSGSYLPTIYLRKHNFSKQPSHGVQLSVQ